VFNDKLCKGSFEEAWRETSADAALLYQLLYWSSLHIRWLYNPEDKQESHEALTYYASAVSIINARVQDRNEATSELTIRLVIMLLFYNVSYNCTCSVIYTFANVFQYCIRSTQSWRTHISGLKQIIKLRGGLGTFSPPLKYLLTRLVAPKHIQCTFVLSSVI
jgi:hypothetical protein